MMDIEHNGNPRKFSYYKVTLEKMLNEGLLYKRQCLMPHDDPIQQMDEADYFNYKRAECGDDETFNREYMCIPCDEQSAFLSYDLIASCEYPARSLSLSAGGDNANSSPSNDESSQSWCYTPDPSELSAASDSPEYYLGVDIGRDRDLTVMWLLEKLGSVYYTRAIEVMEKTSFEAQEKCLYDLLALPQVKRCCIDQTGLGRQFTERAQNRFGKYKVEGIHFTAAVKEELAYPVRMAFEDRTIRIPNDRLLRADLRAIRKEHTASGNVRFSADRGVNGHADRFWALALALHATKRKCAPLEITIGY
jgi:phage FluMu gp28-like protein